MRMIEPTGPAALQTCKLQRPCHSASSRFRHSIREPGSAAMPHKINALAEHASRGPCTVPCTSWQAQTEYPSPFTGPAAQTRTSQIASRMQAKPGQSSNGTDKRGEANCQTERITYGKSKADELPFITLTHQISAQDTSARLCRVTSKQRHLQLRRPSLSMHCCRC